MTYVLFTGMIPLSYLPPSNPEEWDTESHGEEETGDETTPVKICAEENVSMTEEISVDDKSAEAEKISQQFIHQELLQIRQDLQQGLKQEFKETQMHEERELKQPKEEDTRQPQTNTLLQDLMSHEHFLQQQREMIQSQLVQQKRMGDMLEMQHLQQRMQQHEQLLIERNDRKQWFKTQVNVPAELELRRDGVWARAAIKCGQRYGPFLGKWLTTPIDTKYAWEVSHIIKVKFYVIIMKSAYTLKIYNGTDLDLEISLQ